MVPFVLFNTGCFTYVYNGPDTNHNMGRRFSAVEVKLNYLSNTLKELDAARQTFDDNLEELSLGKIELRRSYAQLKIEQASIESLRESRKAEREQFKEELLKTNNAIQEFALKLNELSLENGRLGNEREELAKKQATIESLQELRKIERKQFDEKLLKAKKSIQMFGYKMNELMLEEGPLVGKHERTSTPPKTSNEKTTTISGSTKEEETILTKSSKDKVSTLEGPTKNKVSALAGSAKNKIVSVFKYVAKATGKLRKTPQDQETALQK